MKKKKFVQIFAAAKKQRCVFMPFKKGSSWKSTQMVSAENLTICISYAHINTYYTHYIHLYTYTHTKMLPQIKVQQNSVRISKLSSNLY